MGSLRWANAPWPSSVWCQPRSMTEFILSTPLHLLWHCFFLFFDCSRNNWMFFKSATSHVSQAQLRLMLICWSKATRWAKLTTETLCFCNLKSENLCLFVNVWQFVRHNLCKGKLVNHNKNISKDSLKTFQISLKYLSSLVHKKWIDCHIRMDYSQIFFDWL